MHLTASKRAADSDLASHWAAPVPLGKAMAAAVGPAELAVAVYANHGRWVVECPDCHGAQIASETDYRFMCHCCANVAVGGLWRAVIWPEEYAEIDARLAQRPEVNQNWIPGQTLDDLMAEEPPPADPPPTEPPTKKRARKAA